MDSRNAKNQSSSDPERHTITNIYKGAGNNKHTSGIMLFFIFFTEKKILKQVEHKQYTLTLDTPLLS